MNPQASVLLAAFNQAWNPVVITSADASAGFPVEFANPAFCTMTGYALNELQGKSLKMLQGPDTNPAVIAEMRECLRQGRYFEGTTTNYRKDRTAYVVRWRISPVRDERGELTHFLSIQQDMTELARSRERTQLLTQGLDAASDPIMVADVNSEIIFVNKAFSKASGYLPEELIGKTPSMLKSGAHDATFYEDLYEALAAGKEFKATFVNRRKDGSVYHNEQHISPVMDSHGKITHYISVSRDITDRVEREHALKQAASTDQLTGLFNRHYGAKLLNEAHRDALLEQRPLSLIICDIDHFKRVNDQYGHLAGDRVLRSIAQVLKQTVRSTDLLMRWGGEEFVILLKNCDIANARLRGEQIRSQVESFRDDAVEPFTVSLGVASLKANESIDDLLARSDKALYASKRNGRNQLTLSLD